MEVEQEDPIQAIKDWFYRQKAIYEELERSKKADGGYLKRLHVAVKQRNKQGSNKAQSHTRAERREILLEMLRPLLDIAEEELDEPYSKEKKATAYHYYTQILNGVYAKILQYVMLSTKWQDEIEGLKQAFDLWPDNLMYSLEYLNILNLIRSQSSKIPKIDKRAKQGINATWKYQRKFYTRCPPLPEGQTLSDEDKELLLFDNLQNKLAERTFYKYLPINTYSLTALSKGSLSLSDPSLFNDPTDSILLLNDTLYNTGAPKRRFFASCFTSRKALSLAMMGLYGDSQRGMRIGFRFSEKARTPDLDISKALVKVEYRHFPYEMSFKEEKPYNPVRRLIGLKDASWQHEEEARLVMYIEVIPTQFTGLPLVEPKKHIWLPDESIEITQVLFGSEASKEDVALVRSIFQDKEPRPKLLRLYPARTIYKDDSLFSNRYEIIPLKDELI